MTNLISNLIYFTHGASASIAFLCSAILWNSNWLTTEEDKPTSVRKWFAAAFFIAGVAVVAYFLGEHNDIMLSVSLCMSFAACSFLPLCANILKHGEVTQRQLLISLAFVVLFCCNMLCRLTHPEIYAVGLAISYLYFAVCTAYSLYILKRWDQELLDNYSDIIHKKTRWFRHCVYLLMVVLIASFVFWYWTMPKWFDLIYFLVEDMFFIICTIFALKHEVVPVETALAEGEYENEGTATETVAADNADEIQTSDDTPTKQPAWAEKLEQLMTEEKIFRKEGLTRDDLADMLRVNRTYLSNYLRDELNVKFYDYINKYRIDESERLLLEGELSIVAISERCGFKDRSAFFRHFQKRHGMSPSEWQRRTAK